MDSGFDWKGGVELKDVRIFESDSSWTWNSPARPHFNLWILLEGAGGICRNAQEWPLQAGAAFLFRPEDVVSAWTTGHRRRINFAAHFVPTNGCVGWDPALFAPEHSAVITPLSWLGPFCRHLSELFYLDAAGNRPFLLQGLGLLFLSLGRVAKGSELLPNERALLGVIERIRRNPAASYTVPELAAEIELSPSQFTRRFKAFTGRAPGRFVVEERIARAESYLLDTELTIEEIADRLGYRDVYFFSRQFRQFRGTAPSFVRTAKL